MLNRWTNFDELYLKTDINDITVLEGQNPQNRQNRPQYSFSSRNAKLLQSQYLQKNKSNQVEIYSTTWNLGLAANQIMQN